MWLRLITSWLILLFLTGTAGVAGNDAVRLKRLELAHAIPLDDLQWGMTLEGMSIGVVWRECGQFNAFYDPDKLQVIMCLELMDQGPGYREMITRFIFAHEMAHAIIHQKDIPYTGSQEVAADELATLVLLLSEEPEAVVTAARLWQEYPGNFNPMDPHLHGSQRAFNMLCLWAGSEGDYIFNCADRFKTAVHNWSRLLNGV